MKTEINSRIVQAVLAIIGLLALLGTTLPQAATQTPPLRLGIIGLDTSHVLRFTELLNDPSRPSTLKEVMQETHK